VGVGPEQNFSYIARLRPSMAFIVDIRRENRNLHLLYKALFEISSHRAAFVSRLFSRPCPASADASIDVERLFAACESAAPSRELYAETVSLIREQLVERHAFPLTPADLEGIDRVLTAFLDEGPSIHFWGKRQVDSAHPSYRQLMTEHDNSGQSRSYLSDEDVFRSVKDLQSRNMIVPLVGDFGGPLTLRGIGEYVRAHNESIRAFYGSNVGVYLTNEKTRAFCSTLATLPVSGAAVYIDNSRVRPFASRLKDCPPGPTVTWSPELPE
jgi:hypothetical protein